MFSSTSIYDCILLKKEYTNSILVFHHKAMYSAYVVFISLRNVVFSQFSTKISEDLDIARCHELSSSLLHKSWFRESPIPRLIIRDEVEFWKLTAIEHV